jgi:hypothetical protein
VKCLLLLEVPSDKKGKEEQETQGHDNIIMTGTYVMLSHYWSGCWRIE